MHFRHESGALVVLPHGVGIRYILPFVSMDMNSAADWRQVSSCFGSFGCHQVLCGMVHAENNLCFPRRHWVGVRRYACKSDSTSGCPRLSLLVIEALGIVLFWCVCHVAVVLSCAVDAQDHGRFGHGRTCHECGGSAFQKNVWLRYCIRHDAS